MQFSLQVRALALGAACAVCHPLVAGAQQVPDSAFRPRVSAPAYRPGAGPVVLIDAAHSNFHTLDGGFAGFARLLSEDGYDVRGSTGTFAPGILDSADILVVANAIHPSNAERWARPIRSAFTPAEVDGVVAWVRSGGSLLLIADHMPFAGAAAELAAALGVRMHDGFTADSAGSLGPATFRRSDGTLRDHPVTADGAGRERIDSVTSFAGQAFELTAPGDPLLVMPDGTRLLLPEEAWVFTDDTEQRAAGGMLQGALLRIGKGRVAVFGEAAMFTAQLAGPQRIPVGMNAPEAGQNAQFVLNVLRWLGGALD